MNVTFFIGLTTNAANSNLELLDYLSLEDLLQFISRLLAGYGIDGFNVVESRGSWEGQLEDCLNLSVDGIDCPADAEAIAADLAVGFGQDSVAWVAAPRLNFRSGDISTLVVDDETPVGALPSSARKSETYRIQQWVTDPQSGSGYWTEASCTDVYVNNAFRAGIRMGHTDGQSFTTSVPGRLYRLVPSELPSLKVEVRCESSLDGTVDYVYNGSRDIVRGIRAQNVVRSHRDHLISELVTKLVEIDRAYTAANLNLK